MPARLSWLLFLLLLIAPALDAKDKKKAPLPDFVLRARTVFVLIPPDVGEPVDHPTANAEARDNVEKALYAWGRFQLVMAAQDADLVIAVRSGTGRVSGPTIKGGPIDSRPPVSHPTDTDIRIGVQKGQPPPLNDPSLSGSRDSGPHISNEVGPAEDYLEVYLGNTQYPLDSPPVWRYVAKNCLRPPTVSAVEQLRKAITESEKLQQKKP